MSLGRRSRTGRLGLAKQVRPMARPTFDKYHALGNHFLVVDDDWHLTEESIRRLCDARTGVGADGILSVEEAEHGDAKMIVFNADGSRPEMCANGLRCVARHLVDESAAQAGFPVSKQIETDAGTRSCRVFGPRDGGWDVSTYWDFTPRVTRASVPHGSLSLEGFRVELGNPHFVLFERIGLGELDQLGQSLNEAGDPFSEGVNVELVTDRDGDSIGAAIYERGVGRTSACGTGAVAVAAAEWHRACDEGSELEIRLPGGVVTVRHSETGIELSGSVSRVFAGRLTSEFAAEHEITR